MDWAKPATIQDEKHLNVDIWCNLYQKFDGSCASPQQMPWPCHSWTWNYMAEDYVGAITDARTKVIQINIEWLMQK